MKGFLLNGFFHPLVYIILLPSPSRLMDNKHILLQDVQEGMHSEWTQVRDVLGWRRNI